MNEDQDQFVVSGNYDKIALGGDTHCHLGPGMLTFIGVCLLKVITMSHLQIKAVYHNKGLVDLKTIVAIRSCVKQLQSCLFMRLWHQRCGLIWHDIIWQFIHVCTSYRLCLIPWHFSSLQYLGLTSRKFHFNCSCFPTLVHIYLTQYIPLRYRQSVYKNRYPKIS